MSAATAERQFTPLDRLCASADHLLRTLLAPAPAARANPASQITDSSTLTDSERQHAAGLMRVNHVGEVCAQALYLGQALTARDANLRCHLLAAAKDEADHLAWCADRVRQLDSHLSWLNPVWFAGAYALGAAAGLAGDGWNLGFVVETERQVEAHLDGHLSDPDHSLPAADHGSRAIVEQMKRDEVAHADAALALGARELPAAIKLAMQAAAKVMTRTAYRI
ncbi:2-polyprenyl-3-methyl-6-methoxy-1,4-benzoquinone monooxygenase [Permianibacter sp. IMCC34836]|uniref:2-polyprenyl-3-methyl-6-methoxy-1,4-benzoquinone monooxygenase n=1 Tax=Permianibacter fluminis TaxID=2738515 RepID=UPI001553A976|nr:2-polyprenyl-3-methyl-6-methoxy-1,4-benzoquinone monooxygenase [Permianibacter fluminis]NQD36280.1 2-polyprenyl-3-methyl-6-methoxy-1,4-benzoquinone monooxygenase [Permianibacter fluminis]